MAQIKQELRTILHCSKCFEKEKLEAFWDRLACHHHIIIVYQEEAWHRVASMVKIVLQERKGNKQKIEIESVERFLQQKESIENTILLFLDVNMQYAFYEELIIKIQEIKMDMIVITCEEGKSRNLLPCNIPTVDVFSMYQKKVWDCIGTVESKKDLMNTYYIPAVLMQLCPSLLEGEELLKYVTSSQMDRIEMKNIALCLREKRSITIFHEGNGMLPVVLEMQHRFSALPRIEVTKVCVNRTFWKEQKYNTLDLSGVCIYIARDNNAEKQLPVIYHKEMLVDITDIHFWNFMKVIKGPFLAMKLRGKSNVEANMIGSMYSYILFYKILKYYACPFKK